MRKITNNYIFAALDFIMDRDKNLYFIEANSSPGIMKQFALLHGHCNPIKELCESLKGYKHLAVISRIKWFKTNVSSYYIKYFNGKITLCPYKMNKNLMNKGDGHLIDSKGNNVYPDVILRCGNGYALAQKAAGMKIINPHFITKLTLDKIKVKQLVRKYTNVKTPNYNLVLNKEHAITILNSRSYKNGFILKPQRGQRSRGIIMGSKISDIPNIKKPLIMEEVIMPYVLKKGEFSEIRALAINGKYAGGMLLISPKRPMHLHAEGRVEKIPSFMSVTIKEATEAIVRCIDLAV